MEIHEREGHGENLVAQYGFLFLTFRSWRSLLSFRHIGTHFQTIGAIFC